MLEDVTGTCCTYGMQCSWTCNVYALGGKHLCCVSVSVSAYINY